LLICCVDHGEKSTSTELLATPIDPPALASLGGLREASGNAVTAGLPDSRPILDSRAKAEYRRRIDQLQKDVEEAERFNDSYRAATAHSEIDAITEQLVAAVGLGGRDRRSSSETERARSAVTKHKRGCQQNWRDHPPAWPPLDRQNQNGIFLLLQSAPGSSRRLEVLICRFSPPL